jgi:hypothetical protein
MIDSFAEDNSLQAIGRNGIQKTEFMFFSMTIAFARHVTGTCKHKDQKQAACEI